MDYPMMVWDAGKIKAFWDYECRFQDKYFTAAVAGSLARFLRGRVCPGMTVLDYGCGVGFLAEALLAAGGRVAATDVSSESVEAVSRKLKGRAGFEGAYIFEELQALNRTFDVITVTEVLEHLDDKALARLLENVKQFLKPGGVAFFTTPNEENLADGMVFCPQCRQLFHRRQHIRSWSRGSLSEFMTGQGLSPIFIGGVDLEAVVARKAGEPLLRYARRWLKGRTRLLKYLGGRRRAPHLVCLVRKGGQ